MKITKNIFELIPDGEVFATGLCFNRHTPEGVLVFEKELIDLIRWIAVKLSAEEWAIYIRKDRVSIGHKILSPEYILKLVDCDNYVLNRYNYLDNNFMFSNVKFNLLQEVKKQEITIRKNNKNK